jgi:hypothetical protein
LTICSGLSCAPGSLSGHTVRYGIEGGYDFVSLDVFSLRAQVGIGNAIVTSSTLVAGSSSSHDNSHAYLEPGALGFVSFGKFIVGVGAGVLWLPDLSDSNAAFTAHGELGVRF